MACMPYSATAQNARTAAFGDGEKVVYGVSYRAALVPNVEAGTVTITTTATSLDGVPVYNIFANAKVDPSFKWFYDLDDTYQSWLDRTTLRPVKFTSRLREGKHRANGEFKYDWNKMEVNTHYRNLRRPNGREKTMPLTKGSYDAIGLFYNLRSDDLSHLSPGQGGELKLVLDDTIRVIKYKFLGREKHTVKKIGTFNTLKFSCTLAISSSDNFADGTELFLWVTDDKNKLPVYMESPIKIGSVRVTLKSFEGLKYPLSSKTD